MLRRLNPVLVTPPAAQLVSLAEAKDAASVDQSVDDFNTLLGILIGAATKYLDGWSGVTGRTLITQTWAESFSHFEYRMPLRIRPVQSITSVTYYDSENASQTVASGVYRLHEDATGAYLVQVEGQSWPSAYSRDDAVTITYAAGFGDDAEDVDEQIRHAALLLIAYWFKHREAASDVTALPIPFGVSSVLGRYRRAVAS